MAIIIPFSRVQKSVFASAAGQIKKFFLSRVCWRNSFNFPCQTCSTEARPKIISREEELRSSLIKRGGEEERERGSTCSKLKQVFLSFVLCCKWKCFSVFNMDKSRFCFRSKVHFRWLLNCFFGQVRIK